MWKQYGTEKISFEQKVQTKNKLLTVLNNEIIHLLNSKRFPVINKYMKM